MESQTRKVKKMANYYDDNFGCWEDMDDPDMIEFYYKMQGENVKKECQDCGRMVNIRPEYAICNSCADKREQGWDC